MAAASIILHIGLCADQQLFWHSFEQKKAHWHAAHFFSVGMWHPKHRFFTSMDAPTNCGTATSGADSTAAKYQCIRTTKKNQ